MSHTVGRRNLVSGNGDGTAVEFVTSRIRNVIFNKEIPFPCDVVIVSLLNTCDVLRFIFQIGDEIEQRIEAICKLDLIGRADAEAVAHNMAGPLLRRSALTKKIPTVSRWMELQLAVNVLMVAHYFTLEVSTANFKLRFNPVSSMKPSKKLKFHIVEQRRELQV